MKILTFQVRHYRCLRDVTIEMDNYTALVGPNGSGKSSALYALDWFFNGTPMNPEDFHETSTGDCPKDAGDREIEVEVTFGELDNEDRRILGRYGRGETVQIRRIWSERSGQDKMIGNSRQGPGFADLRAESYIGPIRTGYKALRERFPELADVTKKEDILEQLTRWESQAENADQLEPVAADDASHLFGFNGENVLSKRIRLVLIPAAADISDHTSVTGKTSAATKLIGTLLSEAVRSAKSSWEAQHATELQQLSDSISAEVRASTEAQASRVNGIFGALVPNAAVEFVPQLPEWVIKGEPSVQTDVLIGDERKDVARQGHGVQRAVIMAMLQALVPDEQSVKADARGDDDDETLQAELARLPALVICIEEPEIYQHPVRSRHFARILAQWASRARSQVVLATHSPYFVLPAQVQSLRRFCLKAGASEVSSAQLDLIAQGTGIDQTRIERAIEKEIPHTFSEGFFAEAVVFVEGDTDRVVIETLADRLQCPLDADGIAVLAAGGKTNLRLPYELLTEIGVPVFVVADADALGAQRKYPEDEERRNSASASHKSQTEGLLSWLDVESEGQRMQWGDPTNVTDRWAILHDDLESELAGWSSFVEKLTANDGELRSKRVADLRSATADADIDLLPETLRNLVSAISEFGKVS